jgi:hypothetical protein
MVTFFFRVARSYLTLLYLASRVSSSPSSFGSRNSSRRHTRDVRKKHAAAAEAASRRVVAAANNEKDGHGCIDSYSYANQANADTFWSGDGGGRNGLASMAC